jgi:hypothetical protein
VDGVAILGTAVVDLDVDGRRGATHRNPLGRRAVRWHSLFSSPFFHPTVLVDRAALGELRYDTAFAESEDYDLWTRLLANREGANLAEPLVVSAAGRPARDCASRSRRRRRARVARRRTQARRKSRGVRAPARRVPETARSRSRGDELGCTRST